MIVRELIKILSEIDGGLPIDVYDNEHGEYRPAEVTVHTDHQKKPSSVLIKAGGWK